MLTEALTFGLGYNATLVTLGAAMLGAAAGVVGSFLFLRKRALISDAVSHATLPGLVLAFIVMAMIDGDGRFLPGLMAGAAASSLAGLALVTWMTTRTRLGEDAAIGAVLSVFFGFGVVLLTAIQSLSLGRQAGLEDFLLGSTAGMLRQDALMIAAGGALVVACVLALRRPFLLIAFDEEFARAQGIAVTRMDFALMALAMAITVVGLKIVGLILIVALLIIPAASARFWSDNALRGVALSGLFGGVSGYVGAAVSATAPDLPTGPIIVLIAFALFAASLLFAPARGVLASLLRFLRFRRRVHLRQGLLALATGQPVLEGLTQRLLRRAGFTRADGVVTARGEGEAVLALRNEHRWQALRRSAHLAELASRDDGLTDIEDILTRDQLAEIDRRIGGPRGLGA